MSVLQTEPAAMLSITSLRGLSRNNVVLHRFIGPKRIWKGKCSIKNLNLFRTKKQLEKQRYKTILVGEKITMTSYSREGFIFLKSREKANKSNG